MPCNPSDAQPPATLAAARGRKLVSARPISSTRAGPELTNADARAGPKAAPGHHAASRVSHRDPWLICKVQGPTAR